MPTTTDRTARLSARIEHLASFNDDPGEGGITREVYTATYQRALASVEQQMRDAGLEVRTDAVGNLFGRWPGTDPDAPVVLSGSHIDTTLNAGKYDGVVGVLGALAAVEQLQAEGVRPRCGIEVVVFAGEEPRFGQGCTGSLAAVGRFARHDLDALCDRGGTPLSQALTEVGLDPDRLADARIPKGRYQAFLELHIEQGAVLETAEIGVGVVTHIAAPHDLHVCLRGAAMHAGATPMGLRRDALAGAAEAMLELERLAAAGRSGRTVATVGVLEVRPGAINVIPGEVHMDVDVRDVDEEVRTAVVEAFLASTATIAARRGLQVTHREIGRRSPAACDERIVEATRRACAHLAVTHLELVSGAYHDAMVMSEVCPIGMIFVPSVGGVSHSPLEHTEPQDIQRGVEVLARALDELAA